MGCILDYGKYIAIDIQYFKQRSAVTNCNHWHRPNPAKQPSAWTIAMEMTTGLSDANGSPGQIGLKSQNGIL